MKNLFGEETIRTIGLYQPYATLMLHGKVETRWVYHTKKAPFPLGKYLIYSTKKAYSGSEFAHIAGDHTVDAIKLVEHDPSINLNGYGLCIGDLVRVVPLNGWEAMINTFVDPPMRYMTSIEPFTLDGRVLWGLYFENMRRIKPFPFKGKQGIGFLTAEQKQLIEFV